MLIAAAEIARAAGARGRLTAIAAMPPARISPAAELALHASTRAEVNERLDYLRGVEPGARDRMLAAMPGLAGRTCTRGGSLRRLRWPVPDLMPATHRQKLAVFDRRTLHVGGLDPNGRRFDTRGHDRDVSETWHDIRGAGSAACRWRPARR